MRLTNNIAFGYPASFYGHLSPIDWLYTPTFAWLGWQWKPVRWLMVLLAVLSLWAVSLYSGLQAAPTEMNRPK